MNNILEKIYKIGLKFLVPLTIEENYALIVKEAMQLVKADYGSILMEQKGELRRTYASIPSLYKIESRKRGYMRMVFKTRKPMILTQGEITKVNRSFKKIAARSVIILPLSYRNKSLGVLTLLSVKDNYFTSSHLSTLKLFGPIASLAIIKTISFDETKKALEDRDLFISMAAHEFRTPLTTINGYIQLLYSKLSGANTSEARWVEELSWETTRLIMLVNELLEVHHIKSGKFRYQFKECSLMEVANRAIRESRFTHTHHQVVLEDKLGNHSDKIIGDHDKLLQVVTNLIDNAAKFSPQNTDIILSLRFQSPYLILSIRDQGHGISKKDLPEIFESFYKGSRNVKASGMGLGLFIAKNIIKQHRGLISVRSKKDKGTKVEIKLPIASYLTP